MLILHLLLIATVAAQGTYWPTATLVYPKDGILLVGEGRSCNITFDVKGDPFPRDKTWYKNGVMITGSSTINIDTSGGNIQTLKINSVSRNNEGKYWLVVKNDVNLEASKSPDVIIKVTYLAGGFENSNQVVSAKVGEFAVLQCYPPDHFGAYVKFTWSESGKEIVESDNIYISEYGNLVILQVGYGHYSSSYRCTITIPSLKEGYQTKQGPAVTLEIIRSTPSNYIPPAIALKPMDLEINAQEKSIFRVECVCNGYPNLPSIRWYHDNQLIASSSTIYELQKRHYLGITIPRSGGNVGGTYRCEASDSSTTEVASATIVVYTKPIITTGLPTSEVKKASGGELSLSCQATSTPSPKFYWYKNAQRIQPGINTDISGGSLKVANINTLSKGVYQCEAYNAVGSSISTGKMTVQERLTFVIRPQDVEVYLGTSATFNCMGKGDPGPQSLTWKFSGDTPPDGHEYTNDITNQATYKIPRVTSSDAGSISCIISSPDNLYPRDEAIATLTIRQGPQVRANENSITKTEGTDADLACLVENVQNAVSWKWLFEGILITEPDSGRITIKNSLLQVRSLTEADAGTYTCQADENGLANSDIIVLTIKTFPKIIMDDVIRIGEGLNAQLMCLVTGYPKPDISWKRNGQTVITGSKYDVTTANGKSVLTVRAVDKAIDVGDWTCLASNEIGNKNQNIQLVVVGKCEVMETPKNETINYQGTVKVYCTVNNCPTATWKWQKDGRDIYFDGDIRYYNFGNNIEIRNMLPSDSGVYTCTVDSNESVNKQQIYSADIKVIVPANIYEFPEGNRVLFTNGDNVELKCSAHGEYRPQSPLVVNWYKSNILLRSINEIQKNPVEQIAYVTKLLLIESATASDAGHYQCIANNQYNVQDKRDTSLMLMTFPDRPGQPYNTWLGAGAIELSWGEPADTGNTPLTSYEIEIETKGNNLFRPFMKGLHPMRVSTVIYFLASNQEYRFRVTAVNKVGRGLKSTESNNIRTFEDLNTATLNLITSVTLTPNSSDTIKVQWKEPERLTKGLKGYKIVYRNEDNTETAKFVTIDDRTVVETDITDLSAGTKYSVQVESNTGVTTNLLVSSVEYAYTFNQRPTEPLSCEADRETTSRLQITWQTPSNTHGRVLQYNLYFKDTHRNDGQWSSVVHADPQTTTFVLTLADDGLDYDVKISATNSAGEGETGFCASTGKTINLDVYQQWWFYLIMALIALLLIAAIILCALLLYRRADKSIIPKKMAPQKEESGWSKFKRKFARKPHATLRNQDEFQSHNAQVYSPNTARAYNPMNTFSGGAVGGGAGPYASPNNTMKFGAGAGADFGDFYKKPNDYNYGRGGDNYSYNGGPPANKFNTFDSRSPYDTSRSNEPRSPYDRNPNDFNTYDSRMRDGASSRGYPTYDRNTSNSASNYGNGGGTPFKSSKL